VAGPMPDPMLVLHPAVLVLDPVMLVLPPEDFNLFGFLRDDFKILISPLSKQTSPCKGWGGGGRRGCLYVFN
jgi:hypothetical protein